MSAEWANQALAAFLYGISVYGVPLLIGIMSLLAFCAWDRQYPVGLSKPVAFQIAQIDAPAGPNEARAALLDESLVSSFETHRSTAPFWFRFVATASGPNNAVIEFDSRHAFETTCWEEGSGSLLGSVSRRASWGAMSAAKAGFALDLGRVASPRSLLCRGSFEGPANVKIAQWSAADFANSVQKFHRDSGLLDGGLGVLAAFVLLTAMVNRQWLYVIFAGWLAASLRMAALSAGWDTQWFEHAIPWALMIPLRKMTAALYYVLTITLFARLFQEDLKRVGYQALWKATQWSCLILLGAAACLSFANFLPFLWILTASNIAVLLFFLVRILAITRSRVALWYALSLVLTLSATFYEVVAAALGIRALIGSVNSVTAALFSSIIVALAIAEQMRLEHEGRLEAQARLHHAYEAIPIGLFTLDPDGICKQTNPAFNALMGARHQQGAHWSDYFGALGWAELQEHIGRQDSPDIELRAVSTDGAPGRYFLVGATLANDRIEGSMQDITERVNASEKLSFLADHDPLTGILNRRGIEKVLANAIQSNRAGAAVAVGYLDLDRFKLINDLFGHAAGDEVLKQVCARIDDVLIEGQKLGRVGGDEFVIVFERASIENASGVCRSIVELIGTIPYQLGERAFQIKGSIGLVELDSDVRLSDVIPLADRACREAKKGQHRGLVVYGIDAPALRERNDELRLVQRFGESTVPEGLFMLMQPIMSVRAPYESLDFEVLLRLREADQSVTPAYKIIGAAEANGRIAVIDRWVLSNTLEWLDVNQSQLETTRFVCVNLSGGSLNDEKFVQDVYAMLGNAGKIAERLCLEITESVALHDLDYTRRFIDRTRSFGTRIALDDFGAGYTSFSYLRELPADAVKIDGSFVKGVLSHPANLAIVAAIVELARNLGMKSIAEWVEDCPTLEALTGIGVDYIQGYAIATPQEPHKILSAQSAASFIRDPRIAQFMRDPRSQAAPDKLWEVADLTRAQLH